jgi:glycosyltransferase involved in cell wall biosynthesis
MEQQYKYMVYVGCMTYNHAPYIKETLDGFCGQQTTFPYVCGIIDDASTDGEPALLRQYLQDYFEIKNPALVKKEETDDYIMVFARHKENVNCYFAVYFLKYNHYQMGKKSKLPYVSQWLYGSKYYAICEGDDYWSDPLKLAKQVKILESDSEIGLCYASAKVYDEDSHSFSKEIKGHKFDTFEQQLLWNYIPTLTVCMRTDLRRRYEAEKKTWEEAKSWKMGDFPMWLWFCLNGKVEFLNDIVAVYRVTSGTASRPQTLEGQLAFVESTYSIKMHFAKTAQVDSKITNKIELDRNKGLAYTYINNGEYRKGRSYSKQLPLFVRVRVFLYMVKRVLIKNHNN